jgi:SAM-dependent methyltransferase
MTKTRTKTAPKRPAPRKKTTRVAAPTAKTADRHVLYQKSVQDAAAEIKFVERVFRSRGRPALLLREDFCGTALLCARWVESHAERQATGIDLDRDTLDWGIEHNIAPLGDAKQRVRLLQQDVRAKLKKTFDVTLALNFSYWVFKTRELLRGYFANVRASLEPDGAFILDAYGGWEAQEPMLEPRKIPGGFTYVWDQDGFDPISHDVLNHIHFEFKDGSKLDRAFSYDWRYWSLPEIQELLYEAGFEHVEVWWDDTQDEEDADYRPRKHVSNQPGWIAYIVATPKAPRQHTRAAKLLASTLKRRPAAKRRSGKRA